MKDARWPYTLELEPLRQRHVEAFFSWMRENGISIPPMQAAEFSGGVLRSAVKAGFLSITNGTGEAVDVGEMDPAAVYHFGVEVYSHVKEKSLPKSPAPSS